MREANQIWGADADVAESAREQVLTTKATEEVST